jgi:hypothetical protein
MPEVDRLPDQQTDECCNFGADKPQNRSVRASLSWARWSATSPSPSSSTRGPVASSACAPERIIRDGSCAPSKGARRRSRKAATRSFLRCRHRASRPKAVLNPMRSRSHPLFRDHQSWACRGRRLWGFPCCRPCRVPHQHRGHPADHGLRGGQRRLTHSRHYSNRSNAQPIPPAVRPLVVGVPLPTPVGAPVLPSVQGPAPTSRPPGALRRALARPLSQQGRP